MVGGLDTTQNAVTGTTYVQMHEGHLCPDHGVPDRPEAVKDGAVYYDESNGILYSAGGEDAGGLETKTFYKLDLNQSPLAWEQVICSIHFNANTE